MMPFSVFKQPQDVLFELAKRFKKKRKKAGYTQVDLASRSGVSLGSLKRFEQTGEINLHTLLSLAHILDSLSDFDSVFAEKQKNESIEKLFE